MELLLFGIAPRPPAAPGLIAQTSPGCSSREGWAGSGGKKKNLWAFVCFPCSPLKCCAKGNSSWRPGFGSPCYAAETSGYALGEPGARPHAPLGSVSQPRLSGVVGARVTSSPPASDGLLQPSPRGRVLFFFKFHSNYGTAGKYPDLRAGKSCQLPCRETGSASDICSPRPG